MSVKRLDTYLGVDPGDDLYELTDLAEELEQLRDLLIDQAIAAVDMGYEITHVAQAAKVSRQTIYNWMYGAL